LLARLPLWARAIFILLVPVAIISLTYTNYQFVQNSPGGNDFLARWMGARFWIKEGISPYDPRVSLESQTVIYGRPAIPEDGEDIAHFAYPLPSMIFFAPFGVLPYQTARAIWMTLLEIGLLLLTFLGFQIAKWNPRRVLLIGLLVFSLTWYHGMRAFILGQFAIIEAVLIAGALLAIQRDNDWLAGLMMALAISKPQMVFLLYPFTILWSISNRRWQLLGSLFGFVLLILGGFLLLMPDWPLQWIGQVLEYPAYSPAKPFVTIIADLFPNFASWLNLGLSALFVVYMLWEWYRAFGKGERWFQWTCALTLVITSMVVVRTATTNYLAMVPGLIMVFSIWANRWNRKGEVLIFSVLIFLFLGLWALFIQTVDGNLEHPIMYLPLPALVLIGLWWVRWWFIRPLRLPLEGLSRRA
jgi:hypothetical protein